MRDNHRADWTLRSGAAGLGLLVGLLVGLVLGVVAASLELFPTISLAGWVFGTAAVFAVASFAWPELPFAVVPGLSHFAFGAVQGLVVDSTYAITDPTDAQAPQANRIAFYIGLGVGVLVLVVWLW
jgi:hypothetical protein